ncbi:MAG TPA: hypothetical protein VI670_04555 [Thermoanaerobaculia bacterium]|jgi:hypothetical protein
MPRTRINSPTARSGTPDSTAPPCRSTSGSICRAACGHRLLPDAFFLELAVAIESSEAFVKALEAASLQLTPAEIRDMLRYAEAYLPFADALERFARGVRHTVAARRANVGRKASSAYRIAQGMNLLVDVSLPVPQAESMKRAFATRRKKPAPVPSPVPVPVPAGKVTG